MFHVEHDSPAESRQPLPVLPLEYSRTATPDTGSARWLRYLMLVGWLFCVAGTIAIFVEVESVLVTGPVLAALALVLMSLAVRSRRYYAVIAGLIYLSTCLTFVILVNFFGWGPRDAEKPFMLIAPAVTAAAAIPTWLVWRRKW